MKRSLASPSTRATMANWIIRPSHEWLEPLYNVMKTQLVTEPVIHADETVIQVLKEPGKTASAESRIWVYTPGRID